MPNDFLGLKKNSIPFQPVFAMTIHKAQGQTIEYAGLYLSNSEFNHEQLYVAVSTVKDVSRLKILVKGGYHTGHDGVYPNNLGQAEIFE
jgi:hypothetical protein